MTRQAEAEAEGLEWQRLPVHHQEDEAPESRRPLVPPLWARHLLLPAVESHLVVAAVVLLLPHNKRLRPRSTLLLPLHRGTSLLLPRQQHLLLLLLAAEAV